MLNKIYKEHSLSKDDFADQNLIYLIVLVKSENTVRNNFLLLIIWKLLSYKFFDKKECFL